MTSDEDAADVHRVLSGDATAFEGLVRRWQKPLVNLAWRFCRRHELAEDLAQEALLQVYRKLASWRADSPFSTWMFRVALNVYRSRLRGLGPELVQLEAPLGDVQAPAEEPVEPARAVLLHRAVAALPERYREAILVHYFEQQDVRSAAAILRVAEGTLKARLSRARALLARSLGAAGPGGTER